VAEAEVADREYVRPVQVEHQKHVSGPGADALHRGELCDHVLVGQLVQSFEVEGAGVDVLGERAQGGRLRSRQT
jgi:hypothetical protein